MSDRAINQRMRHLTLFILGVFLILAGRLWLLQIVRGESFDRLAQANRVRTIPIRAPRGSLYDANGVPLSVNRLAYTVSVVPSGLHDPDGEITRRIGALLGLSPDQVRETVAKGSAYPYEPIRLKRDVPIETVIAIEESRNELPGIVVEEEWVREYPHGELAAHVLGYLGAVDRSDLSLGYRPTDLIGKAGIEAAFESFLRGEDGERYVEVNALSRPIRDLETIAPKPGLDVYLTLDLDLQRRVEEELALGLERIKEESTMGLAGSGAVVVLDARTGGILALASLPGYDLSRLTGDERGSYVDLLNRDRRAPWVNRALQTFPPGSTYKVVTGIAALESGVIAPDTIYNATGYSKHGRRDWTIHQGLPPAGPVTIVEAMGRSANDFFWEMALRTGNEAMAAWARRLGLGEATGIPFAERTGVVPTAAYKRAETGQPWVELDTMNVAIGQGLIQVSPLQMARMYMIVANEGTANEIHLVNRIAAADGRVAFEMSKDLKRTVSAKPETWKALKDGLRSVVQWQRGTAYLAFQGATYDPAGKTGSAQNDGTAAHGWFAGFAPAASPEIVVVVFAEYGESGARAAPIARAIMDYYFEGR